MARDSSRDSSADPTRDRSQSAIAAAAKALNDASAALGEALRSASAVVSETVESEVAGGLRSAARTVDDVAASLSNRSRKRGRTRTDLLLAAATLFAERGYDAASVDDVAAAAGYTKGAVYSHFGSKEGLFLAIFETPCPLDHLTSPAHHGTEDKDAPGTDGTDGIDGTSGTDGGASTDGTDGTDGEQHGPGTRGAGASTQPPGHGCLVDSVRCVALVHELVLFAQRTPTSREAAATLVSQTLEAAADRTMADRAAAGHGATASRADGRAPDERRAVLDEILVALALRHTLTALRSAGVEQVDDATVRRLLDPHDPHGPHSPAAPTDGSGSSRRQ